MTRCIACVFIAVGGRAAIDAIFPGFRVGLADDGCAVMLCMCDEIRSAENSVIDKASFSLRTEMRFLEILI